MLEIIIRYLHFLSFIILAASLIGEHLIIANKMDAASFKKLLGLDGLYGVSAIFVFLFGFLMWFVVGKPSEYYTTNPIFHVKLAVFIVIGLISIVPTVFFIRNRNFDTPTIDVPSYMVYLIRIEIALLALLPLLAILMARGYSF